MASQPGVIENPDTHVDEWFTHDPSEPHHQESHGEFNSPMIFASLGATIVLVLGVAVVTLVWWGQLVDTRSVEVYEQSAARIGERVDAETRWQATLYGSPEWVDQASGTVTIPLDRAQQSVIEMYSGR